GLASPRRGADLCLPGAGQPPSGADPHTMILTPDEYAKIQAQAAAEYPAECCGVVMTRQGAAPDRLLLACRNIQDELHKKDPIRHPRDARTAYYIDPRDLIAMGRHEAQGFKVLTIYHSHIDAAAYFSPTDKHNALINGEPAYPEAAYVVVSVMERRGAGAPGFRCDAGPRGAASGGGGRDGA